MVFDLSFVWAGLIAFAVVAYIVLDGFDLGVGILFPFVKGESDRDVMMNSVAPIWDGNETWLVLGGGGLLAVFPLAYATILPALYAPIIAMLLGLVFRGVAFEFRWRTKRGKFLWDWAFAGGSIVATLAQGIALGALVQGIRVEERTYVGGWWDWLTWFSILTGIALLVGYALLGATWLIMKTTDAVQVRARAIAWPCAFATLGLIGLVSLATPFLKPEYLDRWFGWPTVAFSLLVPLVLLACAYALLRGLNEESERVPFFAAQAIFLLCYAGLGISFYPYIVPTSVTIKEAAAPEASLEFLIVGAIVLIPLVLCYTAFSYWVFRGKVDAESGYH